MIQNFEFYDKITIERIDKGTHPSVRDKIKKVFFEAWSKGLRIRASCVWRSPEEQEKQFFSGRDKAGRLINPSLWRSNARAWESWHQYGFAFDACLVNPDGSIDWTLKKDNNLDLKPDFEQFSQICLMNGIEWGGKWKKKDYPHFQIIPKGLKTTSEAFAFVKSGKLKDGFICLS